MKALQFFTDDYLEICRKASPSQIATFLDDYRLLHGAAELRVHRGPTKLISIRLPVSLLAKLKTMAKAKQIPYQTFLKQLIESSLP